MASEKRETDSNSMPLSEIVVQLQKTENIPQLTEASSRLLIEVRERVSQIIDSLAADPSLITQITDYWAKLSFMERTLGGILVCAPTLAIAAIALNPAFLVPLGIFSAGTYTTVGSLFDEHRNHTQKTTERLKTGIMGVVDTLVYTISALDIARQRLTDEVNRFRTQNDTFSEELDRFSSDVNCFEGKLQAVGFILQSVQSLEASVQMLTERGGNTAVISQLILQFKRDHDKLVQSLTGEIAALKEQKEQLTREISQTKSIVNTLEGTVKTLTEAIISNERDQQAFKTKLSAFLNDKEKSFVDFANRVCSAEEELSKTRAELESSLAYHGELMTKQEQLITKMESLLQQREKQQTAEMSKLFLSEDSLTKGLQEFGFLAPSTKQSMIETAPAIVSAV